MDESSSHPERGRPWNKGKLLGQKAPLKVSEVWAIRVRLQLTDRARDLALLDLAIDSKLRSCDLLGLRVRDVRGPAYLPFRKRTFRAASAALRTLCVDREDSSRRALVRRG